MAGRLRLKMIKARSQRSIQHRVGKSALWPQCNMELNARLRLNLTIDNEAENSGAVRRGHNMPSVALACGLAEAQTDQTKGISLNSTTGRRSPGQESSRTKPAQYASRTRRLKQDRREAPLIVPMDLV